MSYEKVFCIEQINELMKECNDLSLLYLIKSLLIKSIDRSVQA